MIFHIPHSLTYIPPGIRKSIYLSEESLSEEILKMTDCFTDDLFGSHAKGGNAFIVHKLSRFVVDPERFIDDAQEAMAAVGMGLIYTRSSMGCDLRSEPTAKERNDLLKSFYYPHHHRLSEAVDRELKRRGQAVILECHSFPSKPLPYELDQNPNRPEICIGSDEYHTPAWLVEAIEAQCRTEGISFAVNRHFAGTIVPIED